MSKSWFKVILIIMVIFSIVFAGSAFGQLTVPRVSPYAKITQRIGLTDVTIKYHRPAVKDREIWGKLVPYGLSPGVGFGSGNDFPWRAGANENTTISFTDDVMIEGKPLAAGKYGLHMMPTETEWTIIFSHNYSSWGSFHYDQSEDALRVTVTPVEAQFEEWLRYGFSDLTSNSAVVYLIWEKKKIPFKIETNSVEIAIESMKNQLRGQLGFNWANWQQAAFYCLQNNVALDQGLTWIDRSISINKNANNENLKAYILMADGQTDTAMEMFIQNTKSYPENWNVWDSLAEAYSNNGDNKNAVKYYKKALDMAPDGQKTRIEGAIADLEQKS
jgi:hypothetical protein